MPRNSLVGRNRKRDDSSLDFLRDRVRRSSSAMKVIASMMTSMRALLIPGFRDVIGVNAAVVARIKSGECDNLLLSATQSGITGIVNYLLDAGARGADTKVLLWAAWKGHTDIVQAH